MENRFILSVSVTILIGTPYLPGSHKYFLFLWLQLNATTSDNAIVDKISHRQPKVVFKAIFSTVYGSKLLGYCHFFIAKILIVRIGCLKYLSLEISNFSKESTIFFSAISPGYK